MPKKAAIALVFRFTFLSGLSTLSPRIEFRGRFTFVVLGTLGNRTEVLTMMGIVMKKVSLSVAAVVAMALGVNAAAAADLPAKAYTKAPPAPAFDPWDI